MSENMKIWNSVNKPPASALKPIMAGRLKGKTDINPQWRLQVMTEQFGQIGVGWYYTIEKTWTEQGASGELMAFVHIHLHTKSGTEWSMPIVGVGGSAIVAKESSGMYANDEGYKMALTDALSVSMKQLGVASAIYEGLWDGTKYKDQEQPKQPLPKLSDEQAEKEYDKWMENKKSFNDEQEEIDAWGRLPSNVRSAIKRYGESLRAQEQMDSDSQQHMKEISNA